MKLNSIPFTIFALQVAMLGCGQYEKNPVQDLSTLREQGKTEIAKEAQGPVVLPGKTVIVKEEVPVYKESSSVSSSSIDIFSVTEMNFNEGVSSTFQVVGKSSVPGVQLKLTALNLPAGAKFEVDAAAKDRYNLTWTPAFDMVDSNQGRKVLDLKIRADVVAAPSEQIKTVLNGLNREKSISYSISKNTNAPTDLKIVGLPQTVGEDQIVPFQVTVQVLGVSSQSAPSDFPSVVISPDTSSSNGVDGLALRDGSRHIIAPSKDAEYVGNYVWKFSYLFDTKNISVQAPVNKAGEVQALSDRSVVRFNVRAYKGSSSASLSQIVRIALNKLVEAPRFDLSALGQESLIVKPGQKISLKFTVQSAAAKSSLKLDLPNLKSVSGSPKITCAVAALTSSTQNCTLTWNIPCKVNEADLNQEISMSAVAILAGRSSEVVQQTLKVTRSSDQEVLAACAAPVKVAAPKAAPAKPKVSSTSNGAKK